MKDEDSKASERRKDSPRASVEIEVDLSTLGVYYLTKIVNISSGGAFICHPDIKPIGTLLKISFKLPFDSYLIETEAQVTWSYKQAGKAKPSSTGMGVKFLEIKSDDQKKIQAYIDGLLENPKPKKKK